ncbi:recombinase family protein [Vreelandella aquamarina]|uniref:recombinase family protein n=1 Tax=Vreelandella aquamarina TaxID=77097 RepID=UPI001D17C75A|nr:recombinase family protein [Halomonas axialensis]MCC4290643.1 recombinase family protein [Halomonas axialensis]
MPLPFSPRYVAYYRVSTQQQSRSGLGLSAQRQAVNDYLAQYGGEVIAEFQEVESGKKADRPQFHHAADYAELAQATLLVAKLDRLSRDLHFITGLQKRGIRFTLCDLPDVDQLTIHILAAMAQHEAKMISQRTRLALNAAKQRGTVLGNPDIDAIRHSDTQTATQHRTQRQAHWKQRIQRVIQHVEQDEGLSSGTAIAHALNQRGLTTYEGKPFTSATISRLRREGTKDG